MYSIWETKNYFLEETGGQRGLFAFRTVSNVLFLEGYGKEIALAI